MKYSYENMPMCDCAIGAHNDNIAAYCRIA